MRQTKIQISLGNDDKILGSDLIRAIPHQFAFEHPSPAQIDQPLAHATHQNLDLAVEIPLLQTADMLKIDILLVYS